MPSGDFSRGNNRAVIWIAALTISLNIYPNWLSCMPLVSSVVWCEPLSSRTETCFISTGFECCCKLFNTKGEELASISCDGIQDMKWYKASPLTYPNKGESHEFICTASNRRHRIQRLTVDLREGLEPKLNIVPQFVEPSSSLDSLLDEEVTAEQLSSRLYAFKAFAAMHSLLGEFWSNLSKAA